MGYVKNTLAPGEDYLYRAHFNWTYDFRSWFWFALGTLPAAFWLGAFATRGGQTPGFGMSFTILAGAAFASGLVIFTQRYVHRWTTVIAVTSVRVTLKTGLISRNTYEIPLDKIEEVMLHQSFLGRLLGYGALSVHGTGVAVIKFPILGSPVKVRQEIETAIEQARTKAHTQKPAPERVAVSG
ncbi:MAG: PH domain-containing protein [Alphaproteobacteria bacterium]|nr:PH domain-containing protein [Alphaproteobacteria bacterium]